MKNVKEFFYALPRIIIVSIFRLIVRIKVFNYARIPVNEQVIFTINHVTGADPILLMAALKKKLIFFAISDDFKNKFTNFFFRKVANAIPIFQKDTSRNFASFKELISNKGRKGFDFAVFPEGKLNKTDIYDNFKKGAAYFSYKTKLRIVPVYIHNIKGLKAGTRLEENKVTEGMIALGYNLFRRVNIFVGNPIDPIAENIINDFKELGNEKSYREMVAEIHEEMEKNFWDLQDEAREILKNTRKVVPIKKR
ncbi:MAG: lysophospholipid acyltransferase family protein [Candidatus Humimicrobiaceae bacterium]